MTSRSGIYARLPQFSYQQIDANFIKFTNIPLYAKPDTASDEKVEAVKKDETAVTSGSTAAGINDDHKTSASTAVAESQASPEEETSSAVQAGSPVDPAEPTETTKEATSDIPPAPDPPPATETAPDVPEGNEPPVQAAAEKISELTESAQAAPDPPAEQIAESTTGESSTSKEQTNDQSQGVDLPGSAGEEERHATSSDTPETDLSLVNDTPSVEIPKAPEAPEAPEAPAAPAVPPDPKETPTAVDEAAKPAEGDDKGMQKSAMKSKKGNKTASVSFSKTTPTASKQEGKQEKTAKPKEKKVIKVLAREKRTPKAAKKIAVTAVLASTASATADASLSADLPIAKELQNAEIVEPGTVSAPMEPEGISVEQPQPDAAAQDHGDSSGPSEDNAAATVDQVSENTATSGKEADKAEVPDKPQEDLIEPSPDASAQPGGTAEIEEQQTKTEAGDAIGEVTPPEGSKNVISSIEAPSENAATVLAEEQMSKAEPEEAIQPEVESAKDMSGTTSESLEAERVVDNSNAPAATKSSSEAASSLSAAQCPVEVPLIAAVSAAIASHDAAATAAVDEKPENEAVENETAACQEGGTVIEQADDPAPEAISGEASQDPPKNITSEEPAPSNIEAEPDVHTKEEESSEAVVGDSPVPVTERLTPIPTVNQMESETISVEASAAHAIEESQKDDGIQSSVENSELQPESSEAEILPNNVEPTSGEAPLTSDANVEEASMSKNQSNQIDAVPNQEQAGLDSSADTSHEHEHESPLQVADSETKHEIIIISPKDEKTSEESVDKFTNMEQPSQEDTVPSTVPTQEMAPESQGDDPKPSEIAIERTNEPQPEDINKNVDESGPLDENAFVENHEEKSADASVEALAEAILSSENMNDAGASEQTTVPEDGPAGTTSNGAALLVTVPVPNLNTEEAIKSFEPDTTEFEVIAPAETSVVEENIVAAEIKPRHSYEDGRHNRTKHKERNYLIRDSKHKHASHSNAPKYSVEESHAAHRIDAQTHYRLPEQQNPGGHKNRQRHHKRAKSTDVGIEWLIPEGSGRTLPSVEKPRVRRSRTEHDDRVPKDPPSGLRVEKTKSNANNLALGSLGRSLLPKLFDGVKAESEIGQQSRSTGSRESASPTSPSHPSLRRSRTEARESTSYREKHHSRSIEEAGGREIRESHRERAEQDQRRARHDARRMEREHGHLGSEKIDRSRRSRKEDRRRQDVTDDVVTDNQEWNDQNGAGEYAESGGYPEEKHHRPHRHHHRHHSKRLSPTNSLGSDKDKDPKERDVKAANDKKSGGGILKRIFGA